jgi:hypothetical protein
MGNSPSSSKKNKSSQQQPQAAQTQQLQQREEVQQKPVLLGIEKTVITSTPTEEENEQEEIIEVADDELIEKCELTEEQMEQIIKFRQLVKQGIMSIEDYEEARDEYLATLGISITYDNNVLDQQSSVPDIQVEQVAPSSSTTSLEQQLLEKRKVLRAQSQSVRLKNPILLPPDNTLKQTDLVDKKQNLKKVEKKEDWKNVF